MARPPVVKTIDKEEVEEILMDLILEGKVQGRIDQVTLCLRLELERQHNLEKQRYVALQKWNEALESVHMALMEVLRVYRLR